MDSTETKSDSKIPYCTVESIDKIVRRLRAEYSEDSEDSEEVCALLEFRRILKQLRVHNHDQT